MNKVFNFLLACIFVLLFFVSGAMAIDFTLNPATGESYSTPETTFQDNSSEISAPVIISPLVKGVAVQGNALVGTDAILSVVQAKPGGPITQDKINADIKAIYSMGYFGDVKADLKKAKDGTLITYVVTENPVLSGILISGNTVYSMESFSRLMKSKTGSIISFANIQEDMRAIDALYHNNGYILEKVVDMSIDPSTNALKIKISEGMIDSVILDGNNSTRDYVIIRELNSKTGTVLNEKVLGKDLKRVFNLGFFSDISPDFEPSSSPDKVNLVIKVKETKTNTINFGGGYGEREGWFGFVDLSANNLIGTGQAVMLRGQAGQQQSTYQFKYTYPWFLPDKLGDRVSVTIRRWLTQGKNVYLLETVENEGLYNGWDISFNKPFTDEWSGSLTVGTERADPYGTATFEPYTSNTIGVTLSYDTRDNWMNPSKGQFDSFAVKKGFKIADSGNTEFSKFNVDLNRFIPAGDRTVFAGHAGFGLGLGDVPIGEIFYAGGANTIRGYEPIEARIGSKRVLLNAEIRYTFSDMFQGVFFFDWGNAWNDGWPDTYNFISGKGFGLRLNTPMGPIRLDYGIGSNRSFSEGVLHFSIGQAF